jgi:hypothetical protein
VGIALRVGCAEDILEIDESSGSRDCVTDLESLTGDCAFFDLAELAAAGHRPLPVLRQAGLRLMPGRGASALRWRASKPSEPASTGLQGFNFLLLSSHLLLRLH